MFAEIETRLSEWSIYEWQFANDNVGFPAKNILCAFMEGRASISTSTCLIAPYSRAQQTGMWLKQLTQDHPGLGEVICTYYLAPPKMRVTQIARMLGISKRTLNSRIRDAKVWLLARLHQYEDRVDR